MGIDVSGGLFYGADVENGIAQLSKHTIRETLYDRYTGKPEQKEKCYDVYLLKIDIPEFGIKKGDIYLCTWTIPTDGDADKLETLSRKIKEPFYLAEDGILSIPICETGYYSPQDVFIKVENFEDRLKIAIENWNSVFPDIPGKLFSGIKCSY